MRPRPRYGSTTMLPTVVLAGLLAVGGCSVAAPPISPTAGVDGLVVPTPSPEASDFVATVDNVWFPLPPGRVWRYAEPGSAADAVSVIVEVVDGVEIAGVPTVGLSTRSRGVDGSTTETLDYYAQDDAGNVWWFGREGLWRAGESGAQAGLMMADRPRRGDGYAQGAAPDVAAPRAEVVATQERYTTGVRTYDDVVAIESVDSAAGAGSEVLSYYAPDTGLIRRQVRDSATGTLELVSVED